MRPALRGLALLPSLLLFGCATARIESNLRAGYTKSVDRVYVLLATSSASSKDTLRELQAQLTGRLEMVGVANKVHFYDSLALDEKATIKREIEELKPGFVMQVQQTSRSTVNGGASGASYELSLSEAGEESLVWKAELRTSGGMAPQEGSAETTAKEIIDRLIQDGLIKPKGPAAAAR